MTCRSTRAITQELLTQRDMLHTINRKITEGFATMTSDQQHLENDVSAIVASVATAVAELKAQIANGTTAQALDFTSLDELTSSTAAEAASDAPAAPPAPPTS